MSPSDHLDPTAVSSSRVSASVWMMSARVEPEMPMVGSEAINLRHIGVCARMSDWSRRPAIEEACTGGSHQPWPAETAALPPAAATFS
eukprot:3776449-Rhodomonas_salina.1